MSDTITMPDGSEYTFVEVPADPARQPLVMEFLVMPDAIAPPPHVHPGGQRESFEVLDGSFELRKGSDWHRVEAGQTLTVEPGEVHTFRNRSGAPVRIRNVHDPAHSFERYLRRLHATVTEHGITSVTPKAALYMSMLFAEHGDTIRAAIPPQRAGMAVLARVGRALRLRLPD